MAGRGGVLPRSATNLILSLSLGASTALMSGGAYAQNSDTQPAQTPQSRSAAIRQMMQQEAARRNAARQGAAPPADATGTTQPATAPAPVQTAPATQSPVPPTQAPVNQTQVPVVPNQPLATPAATIPAAPATFATSQAPALVKSVRIGRDKTGSIIEIVNSRAIAPAIQTLNHPPRLVIDLPDANVAVKERFLVSKGNQFTELHVDQFQETPPVTRVTVDLTEAKPYTWDAAGNRLTIRLKPAEDPAAAKVAPPAPAQPATIPTFSAATKPAVVPVSSNGAGSAVIVGSRIGSGSSVTASTETAVLHIARGGELHVCPNSTVSVTASKNGQELMFGMSTGTLETHYRIEAGSDAVLTPDFRMLLAGPGDFDYAISTNSHGDTCVRALLGNTASMLVSELMGDRTYQVKPTEQVVFHEGRIDRVSNDVPFDCGCAAPPPPVMRASTQPEPTQVAEAKLPPNLQLPSSNSGSARASIDPMLPPLPNASRPAMAGPAGSQAQRAAVVPEAAAPVRAKKEDLHVQIEAPLVFRASDRTRTTTTASNTPPGSPVKPNAAPPPTPAPAPQPKPAAQKPESEKEHRGFFGKVKGFFSSIFH